jgi:O-antigen/teichoic acid export membrane protein
VWFAHFTPWASRALDLQRMVVLLLLGQYLTGLSFLGQTALYYTKTPHDASISVGAGAVVLLGGLALLVPLAGGMGAASAQVASGTASFLIVMFYEKFRRHRYGPWHGFLGFVALSLPCVLAAWLFEFAAQFGVLIVTVLAYGAMMLALGRRLSVRHAIGL